MRIDRQIIESIIDSYLDDDEIEQNGAHRCDRSELIEKLVLELNHMDATEAALANNLDRMLKVDETYRIEAAECKEERKEIIRACTHHSTTFYPDAGGGNDSETLCNTCGRVLR